jgi:hypothetical protein
MTSDRNDDDNPWKKVLEKYFQEFMLFFFPDIYDDIDWEKGYESFCDRGDGASQDQINATGFEISQGMEVSAYPAAIRGRQSEQA